MQTYQNDQQGNYGGRPYGGGEMSLQQWEQEVQRPNTASPAIRWGRPGQMNGRTEQERAQMRLDRWQAMLSTQPLDLSNPMSQDAIENPMSQAEVALGSLKGLLMRNLGHYVVATFVVGVSDFVVWRGILESVGNDYLIIYQPNQDRHISGDFYSLKFIEFHNSYEAIMGDEPEWRNR